jgi:energy-coupling factor transport system substrate-specific component
MDLWFWPYLFDPRQLGRQWQPGDGLWTTIAHFAVFYVATSLWWDLGRAFGNLVLIALFGPAVLRLLRRFKKRFHFELA